MVVTQGNGITLLYVAGEEGSETKSKVNALPLLPCYPYTSLFFPGRQLLDVVSRRRFIDVDLQHTTLVYTCPRGRIFFRSFWGSLGSGLVTRSLCTQYTSGYFFISIPYHCNRTRASLFSQRVEYCDFFFFFFLVILCNFVTDFVLYLFLQI